MPRDFVKLNKKSVQQKAVTAQEVYKFRKTHDIRIQIKTPKKEYKLPSDKDSNHVYGIKTTYGETAEELIKNKYGNEWIKEQERLIEKQLKEQKKKKKDPKKDIENFKNRSLQKKQQKQEKSASEFKMKKFLQVQPKVQIPK